MNKQLFYTMLLAVLALNSQLLVSSGASSFNNQVDTTDCGRLPDLYYYNRPDLNEAQLQYLLQKINHCKDRSNHEVMDRLRDSVFDRIDAQRYQKARKVLPGWLFRHYDDFKN